MAKKEIKIQITKENYEYLLELKKLENNKNKNISDLINLILLKHRLKELIKKIGE